MSTIQSVLSETVRRISFAVFFLLCTNDGIAISRMAAEVRVGQAGDLPCFSIPDERETRNYPVQLYDVIVYQVDQRKTVKTLERASVG